MLRAIVLSLLALSATAPLASAAQDLVDVNVCEKYYVCPILVAQPDPLRVCAGLGLGLQGVAACAYERQDGATCARVIYGFNHEDSCEVTDRLALEWSLP